MGALRVVTFRYFWLIGLAFVSFATSSSPCLSSACKHRGSDAKPTYLYYAYVHNTCPIFIEMSPHLLSLKPSSPLNYLITESSDLGILTLGIKAVGFPRGR